MLNDRERQMLNDLELQLLLEDPVLVRQFRSAGKPADTEESGSSTAGSDEEPPQWYDLVITMMLGVAAPFVAFVALPGAPGAMVGITLLGAVAWAR